MSNSYFRFCCTRDTENLLKDTEKHHLFILKKKKFNLLIIKTALQRSTLETSGCGVTLFFFFKAKQPPLKEVKPLIQTYWIADNANENAGIYRYWEVSGCEFYQ